MKLSFSFIQGWKYQIYRQKTAFRLEKLGKRLAWWTLFLSNRFAKIRTFLICLATAGPFSAYLHHLADHNGVFGLEGEAS
jgi:hypothetical protein